MSTETDESCGQWYSTIAGPGPTSDRLVSGRENNYSALRGDVVVFAGRQNKRLPLPHTRTAHYCPSDVGNRRHGARPPCRALPLPGRHESCGRQPRRACFDGHRAFPSARSLTRPSSARAGALGADRGLARRLAPPLRQLVELVYPAAHGTGEEAKTWGARPCKPAGPNVERAAALLLARDRSIHPSQACLAHGRNGDTTASSSTPHAFHARRSLCGRPRAARAD